MKDGSEPCGSFRADETLDERIERIEENMKRLWLETRGYIPGEAGRRPDDASEPAPMAAKLPRNTGRARATDPANDSG